MITLQYILRVLLSNHRTGNCDTYSLGLFIPVISTKISYCSSLKSTLVFYIKKDQHIQQQNVTKQFVCLNSNKVLDVIYNIMETDVLLVTCYQRKIFNVPSIIAREFFDILDTILWQFGGRYTT